MPGHNVHKGADLAVLASDLALMLGIAKSHGEVHEAMDFPVKLLKSGHRRFFHDDRSILLMFGNDPERLRSAYLHKLVDEACTANPALKTLLELLAAGR